mmetsp:Transcript_26028/g.28953  ORF Transcript_26028/g.28953 Transcript_26028/m.28953 type:complete len:413 (+) Transcript_26028:3-1241(+)
MIGLRKSAKYKKYDLEWLGTCLDEGWYIKKEKKGLFLCGSKSFGWGPLERVESYDAAGKKCILFEAIAPGLICFDYAKVNNKKMLKELREISTRGKLVASLGKLVSEELDKRNRAAYNNKKDKKTTGKAKEDNLELLLPWQIYIQWDSIIQYLKKSRDLVVNASDDTKLAVFSKNFFVKPNDRPIRAKAQKKNLTNWKSVIPDNFLDKDGPFSFMIDQVSTAKKLISELKLIEPGNYKTFTRLQVHTLMSIFFLGFFGRHQDKSSKLSRLSTFKAGILALGSIGKRQLVVALTHYFNQYKNVSDFKEDDENVMIRWLQLKPKGDPKEKPPGVENCVFDEPDWENSNQQLCDLQVDLEGGLEDVDGASKICFADPYPGGTILSSLIWTQEEVLMGIFPEVLMMLAIIPHIDDT